MKNVLKELKLDVYKLAAMEAFHTSYGQVTASQRRMIKEMMFAYTYGNVGYTIKFIVTDSYIKTYN